MIPDLIFDGHSAILGRVGSGKSFAARGIVEGWLGASRRVCIIDPTDCWWGLRSNAAGDGAGFPVVVFGGDHADVPIGVRSGPRIANIVGTRNTPAIIVTGDMSGHERYQFMAEFLTELFRINRTSLHLVVDEADDIAPQKPFPESARMLGAMERVVRRGRVRGFQVMMITQRPAVLNKNVLTQADTLVAMRMPAPQDRKALDDWITGQADVDQAKEVLASLSALQRGEGWVWSPQNSVLIRQVFPLIKTFDSMRTPEHGEIIQEPTALAPVEVGDLLALLDPEIPADPKMPGKPGTVTQADLQAAEKRGYDRGYAEGGQKAFFRTLDIVQEGLLEEIESLRVSGKIVQKNQSAAKASPAPVAPAVPATPTVPRDARPSPAPLSDGVLHPAARKLLAESARHAPARFTWVQLATLAGLKPSGGHFNSGRKDLRDRGLILEDSNLVLASPAGIEEIGETTPAPSTPAERLDMWCARLPKPAPDMLRTIVNAGGWIDAEGLASTLGIQPRGGHWNLGIAMLRNNGLIEASGKDYRASELFGGA